MNCDVCFHRHLTSSAVTWCPECDEKLCEDCIQHHDVSRSTRDHNTIKICDYQKLPSSIIDIKYFCPKHDEKFLHYCSSHNEALCKKCILDEHKTCYGVRLLDEVTRNAKSSAELDDLVNALDNIEDNIRQIEDDRHLNMSDILKEKTKFQDRIKNIKQQINNKIDNIEKKALDKLTKAYENEEKKSNAVLGQLKEIEVQVQKMKADIETIQMYASNFQTFISTKEMGIHVAEAEAFLQSLFKNDDLKSTQINFKQSSDMISISDHLDRLGDISVESRFPAIQYLDAGRSKAQIILRRREGPLQRETSNSNILEARPKSRMERSFKGKTLTLRTNMLPYAIKSITACCFLPGKRLLLSGNQNLEIFDLSGTYVRGFIFEKEVYAITCIDPGTLGVSSGRECTFSIVELDQMNSSNSMATSAPCLGICVLDERLIYGIQGKGIFVYNIESRKTTIEYKMENLSWGSHMVALDERVFLTDPNTNTVIALNSSFKLVWTFQKSDLLSSPTCITIDDDEVLYIVGQKSRNVVAIKSDGSRSTEIFGKSKDIETPKNISVYEHTLFIPGGGDKACMFELS